MGTLYPWPETLSGNKKRVIEELVEGQQCAAELQIIVHKPSQQGSAEELVKKILRSFNQTLSMLTDDEVSQNQATSNDDSPYCDDCKSQVSTESSKRPTVSKDRRGCYKRKRVAQTWTVVSDKMEDGHAWRKYGQKNILNSKHPRSYFRCNRKYDQSCRAIKQVQRMEDDSQMYHITYIGTHTCRDSSKASQIIKDYESCESYDMVTSKNSKIPREPRNHHMNPFNSPSSTLKNESEEETTPSGLKDLDSMSMWKDIIMGGDGFEFEYGDVISNRYSCNEITCPYFEPVELESGFSFDDSEFV